MARIVLTVAGLAEEGTMRIAVVGGTGAGGRRVVDEVARSGHEAVVVGRSAGVDLLTGAGLDAALAGCGAVVDVSNSPGWSRDEVERLSTRGTGNLLDASVRAGVRHLVVLSVVGSDEADLDYYFGKRRQEALVMSGPVPWSVLRTTRLPEPAAGSPAGVTGPVPPRPVPVADVADVAARLVELAVGRPQGFVLPLVGPDLPRPAEGECARCLDVVCS
ncbi:SDR family oxidoreductase [Saccharothrix stipae]